MDAAAVRVFMSWQSRVSHPWVNTFEFLGPNGPTGVQSPIGTYDAAADACVTALRQLARVDVQFLRVVSSTWLAETGGYDPSRERSRPLSFVGLVGSDLDSGKVDLRIALRVDRQAASGRPGRLAIRGFLGEALIRARSGRVEWEASEPGTATNASFAAFTAALGPHMGVGTDPVRLALIGGLLTKVAVPAVSGTVAYQKLRRSYGPPYHTREVAALVMMGPTIISSEHAYFDRP